jgi:hypothetical protein
MSNLLRDIEAFVSANGISERQFGILMANDKNLVPQLRGDGGKRPRRLWPETEAKIRLEMASYRPAERSAA